MLDSRLDAFGLVGICAPGCWSLHRLSGAGGSGWPGFERGPGGRNQRTFLITAEHQPGQLPTADIGEQPDQPRREVIRDKYHAGSLPLSWPAVQASVQVNKQSVLPTVARREELAADTVMAAMHPGKILLKEFLESLAVSQYRLAKEVGKPTRQINDGIGLLSAAG